MELTAGPSTMTNSQHVYEVRPRKDKRLSIFDPLQFDALVFQTTMAFPASQDRARIVFECPAGK